MTIKLLTEHHFEFLILKVGRTGLSESSLAKMPQSNVTAHFVHVVYASGECSDDPAYPCNLTIAFGVHTYELGTLGLICKSIR